MRIEVNYVDVKGRKWFQKTGGNVCVGGGGQQSHGLTSSLAIQG